ncbi:MAG TPA: hypothetical protein VJM31_02075 [Vicinamibacterales bacterium]|nr:hypothetical protein [Vicinamibacterales bacterium]
MLWDPRNKARNEAAAPAAARPDDGQLIPTKALRKFLTSLTSRESPVLMDLGPVVGSNVTFLGERLGCKILLEDLFADLERHARGSDKTFAEFLQGRFRHDPASVDGILCWNFFDFLDAPAAQALARALTTLLRPDGAVLAFFATVGVPDTRFSKYVIVDEDSLRQRFYSSGGKRQTALQNRDIIRMFEGLKVSESFLLKTNIREFLFRKPPGAA